MTQVLRDPPILNNLRDFTLQDLGSFTGLGGIATRAVFAHLSEFRARC